MSLNGSLSDGVVEILGDNGAHYNAYVVDVVDPKDPYVMTDSGDANGSADGPLVTLRFKNEWRRREAFQLSRIRLPPIFVNESKRNASNRSQDKRQSNQLSEGSQAEVWRAKKEGHECGFWKCTIKMVKDDFYGVLYVSDDKIQCKIDGKEFHEVVTKDKIRPFNTNPYLKSNPFFRFEVEVPKDVIEISPKLIKNWEIHNPFKSVLSLIAVNYDERTYRLVCIGFEEKDKGSAYASAIKGASLLAETHFRSIRQVIEMRTQIEILRQQLKNLDEIIKISEKEFEILVRVEERFMRFAIGTNGTNIKKVLKLPGIQTVDRVAGVEGNVFRVTASNHNCLRVAKEMLQIQEKVIDVPKDLVAHVIGKGGTLIQEMTDKSGLISIKVKSDDPKRAVIPFHLIGCQEAIESANLMIEFQMNCVKENLELDHKLIPKRMDTKRRYK